MPAGLGPAPANLPRATTLPTEAQAQVLEALRTFEHPATLAELTDVTGLHGNTVREHLASLEADGHVQRGTQSPQGRGRPAATYIASPRTDDPLTREYVGLATTLAAALRRLSRHPAADARTAGRDWGRQLAQTGGTADARTPIQRRRSVVALLERLRFAPTASANATTVRLTRCPLLDAAHEYPDVVCTIHRGVVEGMLATWGDTTTTVELTPFAEPGACVLQLTPLRGRSDA